MPSNEEIKAYVDEVAETYNLRRKMTFGTEVVHSVWREDAGRWLLHPRDLGTGREYAHECQILFAATGQLVEPRPCEIPGAADFDGSIFHSARWDHNVDLEGKSVVVIGNGCVCFLLFPSMTRATSDTFCRHWSANRPRPGQRSKDQIRHADCSHKALDLPCPKLYLPARSAVDLSLGSTSHERCIDFTSS